MKKSESLSLSTSHRARDTSLPVFLWKGTPYVCGRVGGSVTRSHLFCVVMCRGATWTVNLDRPTARQRKCMFPTQSTSPTATKEKDSLLLAVHHEEVVPLILILSLLRPSTWPGLLTGLSESNSLVVSPGLLSLLHILCDFVPVCHLPTRSAFTYSAARSHSSWVKPGLYVTILATRYWVLAGAKCSSVHRWSARGQLHALNEKIQVLEFSFVLHLPSYFFSLLFRKCLYQRSSGNYLAFLSPCLARNSPGDSSVWFQGSFSGGSSPFTLYLEKPLTQSVTPSIIFQLSPPTLLLLLRHSLAQEGHMGVPALFYEGMGRENEIENQRSQIKSGTV